MIDPRALQQHFRRVQERKLPQKIEPPVSRLPDPESLTAIQPIIQPIIVEQKPVTEIVQPTIDTSKLQEELLEVTQALTTLKQTLSQTPIIEPVTVTVPVSVTTIVKETVKEPVIEAPKEVLQHIEDETPYGYSVPKSDRDLEEYNPYGYYSGPKF